MAKSRKKTSATAAAPKPLNGKVAQKRRPPKASGRRSRATPSSPIPPRRRSNASRRSREYLTPDEVEKLLDASGKVGRHGGRDRTLLLLAYL